MQKYIEIIDNAIKRTPWNNQRPYWFSPQERNLIRPLWLMLRDFSTGRDFQSGRFSFWIEDSLGQSLNFAASPSYDLYSRDIIGITFFFDPEKTSIEEILSAILYQTKETAHQ